MNRRTAGYTLLEVVIALTIFGVFLFILTVLTAEMGRHEKRLPVNFMRHPQTVAVLSRMRKDVLDAFGPDPFVSHEDYTQSPQTLVIRSVQENGGVQTVVWDFRTQGQAKRIAYNVGVGTEWLARGVPQFTVDAIENGDGTYGVRVQAVDEKGKLAIDQIYQPRAHD